MRLSWRVTKADVAHLQQFVALWQVAPEVAHRQAVLSSPPPLSVANVWDTTVMALLSSATRWSSVATFLGSSDPAMSRPSSRAFRGLANRLRRAGYRFPEKGEKQLTNAWGALNAGQFDLIRKLDKELQIGLSLPTAQRISLERTVADTWLFKGMGLKQRRNFWINLGRLEYEIPIDARWNKRLAEWGFPLRVDSGALQNPSFYYLIEDGLQSLCDRAGILPAVVDAAVFAAG